MFLKLLTLICIVLLTVAGTLGYLDREGFWSEENKAKRELGRQNIPISADQVRKATIDSDLAKLKLLDTAGVDFHSSSSYDANGNSPLHIAAKKHNWKMVNTLLNYNLDPDVLDPEGRTVTSVVMEAGNISLARRLLQDGALADFTHSTGEPAMIQYLREKNVGNVLTLIDAGVDVNAKALNGESAIYIALKDALYEPTIALIDAGADPNGTTSQEIKLLPHLCQSLPDSPFNKKDTTAIIKRLVDNHADLKAKGSGGWRPIQWCVQHQYKEGINFILEKDKNLTGTLWIALNNEDYSTASLLLQNGADANELGPDGLTPLMTMIRDDKPHMITELLNHDVDPEQISDEGQTALITAIAKKRTNAAIALLRHPTNPAQHTTILATPVTEDFSSFYEGNEKFGWYTRNAPGLTTLMVGVMMDDVKIVEQLIQNGASRTQGTQSRYPVYPIQMAADRKNVQMQQLLIGVPYEDDKQVRKFVIDLSEQKVRYYKNGKLIKSSRVSTGRSGYRTKPGKMVITDRTKHKRSNIYDNAPMPYFQRFSCSPIGFHEGNTYSRYASHGCIRLPMSTAKFFWKEAKRGDRVDIVK